MVRLMLEPSHSVFPHPAALTSKQPRLHTFLPQGCGLKDRLQAHLQGPQTLWDGGRSPDGSSPWHSSPLPGPQCQPLTAPVLTSVRLGPSFCKSPHTHAITRRLDVHLFLSRCPLSFSAYTSHQTRAITDTRTAHCHHQSSMSPGKDLATFTRKLMSGYSTCSIIPGCRPGWWEEERLH